MAPTRRPAALGAATLLAALATIGVPAAASAPGGPTDPAGPADPAADAPWRLRGPFDDVSVAARKAARTHRRVELGKLRTAAKRTYINPDGTTTVVRTEKSGRRTTTTRNTPPSVNHDMRQGPQSCYGRNGLPSVTTPTPTLRVSAADVDHRVHHAKVRVLFEVWPARDTEKSYSRLDPADALIRGASGWVEQNTPASWRVPAGVLKQGHEYVWRARADDGDTVGPYTAWYWTLFDVDTGAKPDPQPCPPDQLDELALDEAWGALGALVEEHPRAYASGYSTDDYWPVFCVVRRPDRSDADTKAAALATARRAIWALRGEITSEYKREIVHVLRVRVVRFSEAALQAVMDDISKRLDRNDPTLPDLQEWGINPNTNVVDVGAVDPTPAQIEAMKERYGEKVRVKAVEPEEIYF